GYTDPVSGQHFTGERAVWEKFQSERNLAQRVVDDLTSDPLNILPSMGAPLTGAGSAIVGVADKIDNPLVSGVLRGGATALDTAGKIADIPENVLGGVVEG